MGNGAEAQVQSKWAQTEPPGHVLGRGLAGTQDEYSVAHATFVKPR